MNLLLAMGLAADGMVLDIFKNCFSFVNHVVYVMSNALFSFFHPLLALLFPPCCLACDEPLCYGEKTLCTFCFSSLPQGLTPWDARYGISARLWGGMHLVQATALFPFQKGSPVQRLIYKIKYKNQYRAAAHIGAYYGNLLKATMPQPVDGIIPVPLHSARMRKRGYNQSEWLAKGISKATGWPCYQDWLVRKVNTSTQTNKTRLERSQNVSNAFQLASAVDPVGKHLLLVDDLVTTGATLKACAHAFGAYHTRISVAVLGMAT
ncbi:MAG: ComF family protein [Cytophagales bacterium]